MRVLTFCILCAIAFVSSACHDAGEDARSTPDERISEADVPVVKAKIRIGRESEKNPKIFDQTLNSEGSRKVLAFMKSANKERKGVGKTPSPDHVILEFRGHRMRCAFDGSWMVDMNDSVEHKFQWYRAPNEKALWKVDRATGMLTFLE